MPAGEAWAHVARHSAGATHRRCYFRAPLGPELWSDVDFQPAEIIFGGGNGDSEREGRGGDDEGGGGGEGGGRGNNGGNACVDGVGGGGGYEGRGSGGDDGGGMGSSGGRVQFHERTLDSYSGDSLSHGGVVGTASEEIAVSSGAGGRAMGGPPRAPFSERTSAVWVSSAGCVTPLHFDLCHGLLSQLHGWGGAARDKLC